MTRTVFRLTLGLKRWDEMWDERDDMVVVVDGKWDGRWWDEIFWSSHVSHNLPSHLIIK